MSFILRIGTGLYVTADDDVSRQRERAAIYPTLVAALAERERLTRQSVGSLFDQVRTERVADDPPAPPSHPRLPPCDLFVWSDAPNGWIFQIGDGVEPVFWIAVAPADDPWRRIIAAVAEVECLKRVERLWEPLRRAEVGNRRARFWLSGRYGYWSELADRWREWGAEVSRP